MDWVRVSGLAMAMILSVAACSVEKVDNDDDDGGADDDASSTGGGTTGTTGAGGDTSGTSTTGTGATTTTGPSSTSAGTTSSSTTGGGSDCTMAGDFNACANCFAMANAAGAQAYNDGIVANCFCANECVDDCSAECADPQMQSGAACDACFNTTTQDQNSGCVQGFLSDCQGNQSCSSFLQELQTCPQ